MDKDLKKLFLVLIIYSLSSGIFLNFQELWLQENSLSISTIGTITSAGLLLSVGMIFVFSNFISNNKLKRFIGFLITTKLIVQTILYLLNMTNNLFFIKFFVMTSFIIDVEIVTAMYPLMASYKKNDKIYALKDLIYESAYNIGIIISSILIGKTIGFININYNSYILISLILLFMDLLILNKVKVTIKKELKSPDIIFINVLKKVKQNKVIRNYIYYRIFAQLAYYSAIGMAVSFLINGLKFSTEFTFYWRIGSALLASVFGFICLKYTPKKDNISIFIKYIMRIIFYILVILTGNKIVVLIAVSYAMLTSLIFADVVDGKYVNIFNQNEQLAFANLSYMIVSVGRAIGVLLCSFAINYNIKINFIFAAVFTIIQVIFINKAIRYNEVNNDRQQLG